MPCPAMAREVFLSVSNLKMHLLINCNTSRLLFDLLVSRHFGSGVSHSQTARAIFVRPKTS